MANFTQDLKDILPIDSEGKLDALFKLLNRRHTVITTYIDIAIFKYLTDTNLRNTYCIRTGRTLSNVLFNIEAIEKKKKKKASQKEADDKKAKANPERKPAKETYTPRPAVPVRRPTAPESVYRQGKIKHTPIGHGYVPEGPRLQKNKGVSSLQFDMSKAIAIMNSASAVDKISPEQRAAAEAYRPEPEVPKKASVSVPHGTDGEKKSVETTKGTKSPETKTVSTSRYNTKETLLEIVIDLDSCAKARRNSGVAPIARVHCLYDSKGETFWFTNRTVHPRELNGIQQFGIFVPKYSDVAIQMQKGKVGSSFKYNTVDIIKRLRPHQVKILNRSDIQNKTIDIAGDKLTYQYRNIGEFLEALRRNQENIIAIESEISSLEERKKEKTSHERGQITNSIKKMEEQYRILTQQQEDLKNITIYIRKQGEMRYSLIVDPIQTSIMEKHLFDGKTVVIKGGPGTGKTTTMIHRLAYLTDTFAIKEDETNQLNKYDLKNYQRKQLLEAIKNNRDWIFFSPSQMLKDYLADAMRQEGLTHTDKKVWYWTDFCRKVLRDYYHILGAEGESTPFYVSYSPKMLFYQNSNIIEHFNSFFIEQYREIRTLLPILDSDGVVYEWTSIARNIKEKFEDVSNYGLSQFVSLFNSLESLYNEDCRRILTDRNNLVKKISEKICVLLDDNNKAEREVKEILEWTSNELSENPLDEEEIDIDSEENKTDSLSSKIQKRLHSLLSNAPHEHELSGEIQKWLKAYCYSKISQKELSDKHDLMTDILLPVIEDKFTDDIRKIGELMVFEQFAQYTRGIRTIMLNIIPSRYKKFRIFLIKSQFEGCNLELLREITLENQGRNLHFQEQSLLLGFINNLVKIIKASGNSKTRHDYIDAYDEVSRPIIGIDEVTDFSVCEIYAMNSLLTREFNSLTLCGDMMQGMTSYGIKSWNELDSVLTNQAPFEMKTSYRQSKKLLELAINLCKDTLEETPTFRAFMQSNRVPAPLAFINENELYKIEWISKRIEEVYRAYANNLPSIAIFVTDKGYIPHFIESLQETDFFKKQGIKVYDGTIANNIPENHICIYPINVVKGMEFDVVFFHNIDKTDAERDLLKRYIYVGLSRAAFFLGITMVEEDSEISRYFGKGQDWFNI